MKKKITAIVMAGVMILGSTSMVFAEEKSVPAHLTMPTTAIDFTITEKINMVGTANSNDLTVDSLDVTNNSNVGVLNIDSISATAVEGWTLVSDTTDFAKMDVDAKQFSLVADGSHDMTSAYTEAGTVDPQAKDTTTFAGKSGAVTTAIDDTKVADVVVTLSLAGGGY